MLLNRGSTSSSCSCSACLPASFVKRLTVARFTFVKRPVLRTPTPSAMCSKTESVFSFVKRESEKMVPRRSENFLPHPRQQSSRMSLFLPYQARTKIFSAPRTPSLETRYFVSSLDPDVVPTKEFQAYIRGHGEVENCLHWQKDRYDDEDKHVLRLPGVGDAGTLLTSIAVLDLFGNCHSGGKPESSSTPCRKCPYD